MRLRVGATLLSVLAAGATVAMDTSWLVVAFVVCALVVAQLHWWVAGPWHLLSLVPWAGAFVAAQSGLPAGVQNAIWLAIVASLLLSHSLLWLAGKHTADAGVERRLAWQLVGAVAGLAAVAYLAAQALDWVRWVAPGRFALALEPTSTAWLSFVAAIVVGLATVAALLTTSRRPI